MRKSPKIKQINNSTKPTKNNSNKDFNRHIEN